MMPWGVWLPPTTGKEDDAPGTVLLPTAGKQDDAPGTVLLPTSTAGKDDDATTSDRFDDLSSSSSPPTGAIVNADGSTIGDGAGAGGGTADSR